MLLHTSISDEYLPISMADPNRLTSHYNSYVLIPNLGPLAYSRLYTNLNRVFYWFSSAIVLLDAVEAYRHKYREIPPTPNIPDEVEMASVATGAGSRTHRFSVEELYTRATAREPQSVLRSLRGLGGAAIESSASAASAAPGDGRMASYKTLLANLAEPNGMYSALAAKDLLLAREGVVSTRLLDASRDMQVDIMVDSFAEAAAGASHPEAPAGLVESMTSTVLASHSDLAVYDSQLAGLAAVSIGHYLGLLGVADPAEPVEIVQSCEWAFQRSERVTLELQRPMFRGPLTANSVAPGSELTLTDTENRVSVTGARTLTGTSDRLAQYNSIQTQVTDQMGILFDYGSNLGQTMSEQGYSQDSMKSEKRSRVESALSDISTQNSSATISTQTVSESKIREYRTEGKDPKFATSELAFEVFTPVEVTHYLDEVSAVWSPRVNNPFSDLRTALDAHFAKTRDDYIQENYVIDPLEPVPSYESVNRVSHDTSHESDPGTYTHTVSFKLTPTEISTGHLYGDDIRLEFHQSCDWYENCYDEDDYWMKVDHVDRHGGDSWVDVTVKYHVDDVTGNDPDVTYIRVSIDKYKATDAYLQELNQYAQTTGQTNPARRNAVKVQARKYAALKRDELIRQYEANVDDLKDYAFVSLMKKMFAGTSSDGDWSYYLGIIRTCIDWNRVRIDPEPCDIDGLYETVLSPYHFLNVRAVRFFLPINIGAEKVFFDVMRNVVDPAWRSLFDKVEGYLNDQREKFQELPDEDRVLDAYDSELVLGRHLEAVLSNTTFSE